MNVVIDIHNEFAQCPKNNLKSLPKPEPVTVGADATVYVWLLFTHISHTKQTTAICSNRDRPGFYAHFQTIFGTV